MISTNSTNIHIVLHEASVEEVRVIMDSNNRPTRQRPYTPPPSLHKEEGQHALTPHRSAVIFAKLLSQKLGISITKKTIQELTGVSIRQQSEILSSKEVRTFHSLQSETRGRPSALTRSDVDAIALYLDDETVSKDDKGKPWRDVARNAGVELPSTFHLNTESYKTISNQTIQKEMYKEGFTNAIAATEK